MKMDIKAKKLSLIEWLLKIKDETLIRQIENLRAGTDFWDDLSEAEKEEIDKGLTELDKGEAHNYESIIARHRKP